MRAEAGVLGSRVNWRVGFFLSVSEIWGDGGGCFSDLALLT